MRARRQEGGDADSSVDSPEAIPYDDCASS
jgi:hypothetical protein